MNIYRPESVNERPEFTVYHWQILEMIDEAGVKSRHVAGMRTFSEEYVSSAIKEQQDGRVITRSGRVINTPKETAMPQEEVQDGGVLRAWKKINKIVEATNVTKEYL